jgi:3-oxoacyl-(acyl-carrier-protein) synthase
MSRIFVSGVGVVSPAGWGLGPMREALQSGRPLPVEALERPVSPKPLRCRPVPAPAARLPFQANPRLRRVSPITHYAAGAALEAVAPLQAKRADNGRIGLIVCLDAGCVQYSCRFFEEALKEPATASPLLFPETVFSALASNIAVLLAQTPLAYTLLGDAGCFLQGLALAADWLLESRVDACVIIGAEELNWLLADALWHLDRAAVLSAGAGAVALVREPALSVGIELEAITDAHTYTASTNRRSAALSMRRQLPPGAADDVLCDSLGEGLRTSRPEADAWHDWPGPRLSPKRILGEGLVAATAWQCAVAIGTLQQGQARAANVSVVGPNQQAIGARFSKPAP